MAGQIPILRLIYYELQLFPQNLWKDSGKSHAMKCESHHRNSDHTSASSLHELRFSAHSKSFNIRPPGLSLPIYLITKVMNFNVHRAELFQVFPSPIIAAPPGPGLPRPAEPAGLGPSRGPDRSRPLTVTRRVA